MAIEIQAFKKSESEKIIIKSLTCAIYQCISLPFLEVNNDLFFSFALQISGTGLSFKEFKLELFACLALAEQTLYEEGRHHSMLCW